MINLSSLLNPQITCGRDLRKYLFVVGGAAFAILLSVYLYQYQYIPYQAEKKLHTATPINQLAPAQGNTVAMMNVATPPAPPIRANAATPGNHRKDGRDKVACNQCHSIVGGAQGRGVAMMSPIVNRANMGMAMNVNAGEDTLPSFKSVVMQLRNSVVNINASTTAAKTKTGQQDGQLHFANPSSGVTTESIGSCVVVSVDGLILTNYHVIRGATGIHVTTFSSMGTKRYLASTVQVDESLDLALLRIQPDQPLQAAPLGDSDRVDIAQSVLAMGSPFGLDQTVSRGIVSAKRKSMVIDNLTHKELIQTDAAINQGNSGGPLVDRNGMVIAINTAIYTPTGAFSGVGFAVPINQAKRFMQAELNKTQTKPVAWSGTNGMMGMNVAVQAAPPIRAGAAIPNSHNDGRNQVECKMCHQIRAGNGGARGGNVAMNGMAMNVMNPPVPPMIPPKATPPGNHAADGRASMICSSCHQIQGTVRGNVVALAVPGSGNSALPLPQMLVNPMMGLNVAGNGKMVVEGAELGAINPLLVDELNLQVADGAFVTAVYPGSAAERAGMVAGDTVFKLNGRWVLTPQQLVSRISAAEAGSSLRLGIYRGGERMNLYLVVSGQASQGQSSALNAAPVGRVGFPQGGLVNEIRWLGMELMPIGPQVVAKYPQVQGKQGSLVKDVKIATVAQNSGVMKGDIVLNINRASVATPSQLDLAIAQASARNGILLLVERNGSQRYVTLQ